ncbi:NETI motif-containing protein [Aquibacillus koreensis]|uniref:NETI motif-containing protein n=1 Tax=Aquibacillus koreensis TaxID=279446 RepID=A0A9X3WNK0_9BACI|nr:NETI motif-containing protein [Aquibacillus koreensis]MCT2536783.1 NETI motif-containing protein [Aquibacillus koreensis]MDC3421461.1 NETI motif-containing protein [Aquibacillus koreensis]
MSKSQTQNQRNKKRFELQENESIDQCLDRIKQEGYTPVRRVEEPVFQEIEQNGQKTYEPVGRKVIFDSILAKHEQ